MAACFVCTMHVHDPEMVREYTALTPAMAARRGGKLLTRDGDVTTAEREPFTERMVMIECPDRAAAETWNNDTDCQIASALRRVDRRMNDPATGPGKDRSNRPDNLTGGR